MLVNCHQLMAPEDQFLQQNDIKAQILYRNNLQLSFQSISFLLNFGQKWGLKAASIWITGPYTPPIAELLCVKNGRAIVVCGFLMKSLKKYILKVWKNCGSRFGSCLLNSTANPAHFHPSLAGLAVLFNRQLPNGSHDFFQTFSIFF